MGHKRPNKLKLYLVGHINRVISGLATALVIFLLGVLYSPTKSLLSKIFQEGFGLDVSTTNIIAIILCIFLLICLLITLRKYFQLKKLQSFNGTSISLRKLKTQYPKLPRISVVGNSNVGKTSLIRQISRSIIPIKTTVKQVAYITNLSRNSYRFAALIDGPGQSQSRQNDNALEANNIVILMDHNISAEGQSIDRLRLESHKQFLALLLDRLLTKNHHPDWIHLTINKKDLWEKNRSKVDTLQKFLDREVEKVKNSFPNTRTTFSLHSNLSSTDIEYFSTILNDNLTDETSNHN